MTESLIRPIEVEIGGKMLRLRFARRAQYRLQGIPHNTDFRGLRHPKRFFATLVNWLWACAIDCPFEIPEELAEAMTPGEGEKSVTALMECIKASTNAPADKEAA